MILKDIFVCPSCKKKLKDTSEKFICTNCTLEYPTINGVPVFLTGEVDSDSMNEFWNKGWENRFNKTDHTFLKDEDSNQLKTRTQTEIDEVVLNQRHAILETLPINDQILLNIGCGLKEAPAFIFS